MHIKHRWTYILEFLFISYLKGRPKLRVLRETGPWAYYFNLFEAPEWIVCTVGSEMWISALATLIARKNKCNLVLESQMVNSVSVKQACPIIALPFCIDHIQSYRDLCAYKLYFRGLGIAYLYSFFKDANFTTPRNTSAPTWDI